MLFLAEARACAGAAHQRRAAVAAFRMVPPKATNILRGEFRIGFDTRISAVEAKLLVFFADPYTNGQF